MLNKIKRPILLTLKLILTSKIFQKVERKISKCLSIHRCTQVKRQWPVNVCELPHQTCSVSKHLKYAL